MWSLVFWTLFLIVILYLFFIIKNRRRLVRPRNRETDSASVLIVVGSGGHTHEILSIVKALGGHYRPRYYVVADTDSMSEHKVRQCEKEKHNEQNSNYHIFYIPRSREVKQSYVTSILTTLRASLFSIPLVFRLKPEVILCNGPGTCIPVCVGGLLLKWLCLQRTRIVYVESFCRVTSLSLSGKLLYHFADCFCVQWPELLHKYPRATYLGRLV